jgi:hypothetical protein
MAASAASAVQCRERISRQNIVATLRLRIKRLEEKNRELTELLEHVYGVIAQTRVDNCNITSGWLIIQTKRYEGRTVRLGRHTQPADWERTGSMTASSFPCGFDRLWCPDLENWFQEAPVLVQQRLIVGSAPMGER